MSRGRCRTSASSFTLMFFVGAELALVRPPMFGRLKRWIHLRQGYGGLDGGLAPNSNRPELGIGVPRGDARRQIPLTATWE